LSVLQDNAEKKIVIDQANSAIEKLTGYTVAELVGKPFEKLLPEREKDMLQSYVEYDDGSSDLASVLRKMLSFHIVNKAGEIILVSVKVFYGISEDPHKLQFELLLRDISLLSKIENLRNELAQERQANDVVNSRTGLVDINSFAKDLGLIHKAVKDFGLDACFAVVKVDNLEGLAGDNSKLEAEILGSTGRLIQGSCRDEDIVGHISDEYIGVILFDCAQTSAQLVFNRVRMLRSSKPVVFEGEDFELTVTSSYVQVRAEDTIANIVDSCLDKLLANEASGGNRIYEV
jgi:PAS domain S-box-containing protein